MGQSLHQSYAHVVFSTKGRQPLITGDLEADLYAYFGGICRDLDVKLLVVDGMPDHVHLLLRTNKNLSDVECIKQIKGSSSKWINEKGLIKDFKWQAGYGWFSVSAKDLEQVKEYLARQKEHHKAVTFKDELRRFLVRYEVNYDERYVWD